MTTSTVLSHESSFGFDIVLSAENNDFMAWQCLVFHHSCITKVGKAPIVVVHGDEPELVDGFTWLAQAGGRIQRAPNFRHYGKLMYAPWNQLKTVELVQSDEPWLVFADTDMVFLDEVDFDPLLADLDERTISLDHIAFLVVHDENRSLVAEGCAHAGIDLSRMESNPVNGATPYLMANSLRNELCAAWEPFTRHYLEAAYEHHGGYDPGVWVSLMWGFALAIHHLDLEFVLSNLCVHTFQDPQIAADERPILHYSYGNDAFNKRRFHTRDRYDELWHVVGQPGHTSGAACDAIRAAGTHFGLTA